LFPTGEQSSFIWQSLFTVQTVNLSGQGLSHPIHSKNMMDNYSHLRFVQAEKKLNTIISKRTWSGQ